MKPTAAMREALSAAVGRSDPLASVTLRHVRDLDGRNAPDFLQRITAIQERDENGELEVRRRPAGSVLFVAGRMVTLSRVAATALALGHASRPSAAQGAAPSAFPPTCCSARPHLGLRRNVSGMVAYGHGKHPQDRPDRPF